MYLVTSFFYNLKKNKTITKTTRIFSSHPPKPFPFLCMYNVKTSLPRILHFRLKALEKNLTGSQKCSRFENKGNKTDSY